ncbi:MAG: hypothetical protein WA064_03445 [Candidatus Moraniibacteriota bacterium]
MKINVQFTQPVSAEKMRHNLRHLKKNIAVLRHYIAEVTEDKFYLKDEKGNAVAELNYFILEEKQAISFSDFRGKHQSEIEQMLSFRFAEEVGEKAFIHNLEKKTRIYFDLAEYFLIEKGKVYKIGLDCDKLIEIESYRVPRVLKMEEGLT